MAEWAGMCVRMWGGLVGLGDPLEHHFFVQDGASTPGAT